MILKSSKSKTVGLLFVSLVFVAASVFLNDEKSILMWICGAFFGSCAIVFVLQLWKGGGYLKIEKEGIRVGTIGNKESRYLWHDIKSFGVASIAMNRFVSVHFNDSFNEAKMARSVIRKMADGMDGILPDTYGMKAEELAELLNKEKQNQLCHTTPASAPC